MQLVEQHIIDKHDPRWSIIDGAAFLSKNLYNAANYVVRQAFVHQQRLISYVQLDKMMKRHPDYCALPRKVSQWVLKQVDHDWQAYFAALETWTSTPDKFKCRPQLPAYKDKLTGRNMLTYTAQAVSRKSFQKGLIQPSQLAITIKTAKTAFNQIRIVPRKTHYVIEVVYTFSIQSAQVNPDFVASIDIGVDNLATVTSNQPGFVPLLVNGRPLKSINQFYNKQRARLQGMLPEGRHTSRRLDALTDKRNRRVNTYLHLASRRIIDMLMQQGIGTLVIGKNDDWKQSINLGKRVNQTFMYIPHARFIDMLRYKAEMVGIMVIVTEESYTSKCSFLDLEPIAKREYYVGKRTKRGLFVASDGRKINADVNGSYNIMRKAVPNAIEQMIGGNGIEGAVVHPVRVTPA